MEWNNLWAPWRSDYLKALGEKGGETPDFLHAAWKDPAHDQENGVVHRGAFGLILLNLFPYVNGHLMVAPGEPYSHLSEMPAEERVSLMEQVAVAERLIQQVYNPQGINVGINIGRAAGAGLPGHLHVHLVPRWSGDTNFMHVLGGVRVIPQSLPEVQALYAKALPGVLKEIQVG